MKRPNVPQRTTPGFSFSMVERALLECIADRRFGKSEITEVLSFFGDSPPTCVFCGSADVERWDHLVAVMQDGDTVLGNMVPACQRCDDSKRDVPYETWATGQAPGSPKSRGVTDTDIEQRLGRIREYVQKYNYRRRTPQERLTNDEFVEFQALRERLRQLRANCDRFLGLYSERIGLHPNDHAAR